MSHYSLTNGLNKFIGVKWALIGVLIIVGSLLWLGSVFFADAWLALVVGIPIPSTPSDFVRILGILFLGVFCWAWGSAMLRRQEWGALAGGLTRLTVLGMLIVAALILSQEPQRWLDAAALSFYTRYVWLIWGGFGIVVAWFVLTIWFLLVGDRRRDYYAEAYQTHPPSGLQVCPKCGLLLEGGRCPEHDRLKKDAHIRIVRKGIDDRRELLPFTEDNVRFVIGRYKEGSAAYIQISELDTEKDQERRISGEHIAVYYNFDSDEFTVKDLASTNKTYLNDEPMALPPNIPYKLVNGTKISLAHAVDLIFEC